MYSNTISTTRSSFLSKVYCGVGMTLIPTVIGAWIGMNTTFMSSFFALNPILGIGVFLGSFFAFAWAINNAGDSPLGIGLLGAFTFCEGLLLSGILGHYMASTAGTTIVLLAFIGTCSIFFVMTLLSSMIKRDLSFMGKGLAVAGIGFIVLMVANLFLHAPMLTLMLSYFGLVLFSIWLLYDIKRISDGGETSVVRATFSIYLNLINIFLSLLRILGNNR